jgi:hypothetical protein
MIGGNLFYIMNERAIGRRRAGNPSRALHGQNETLSVESTPLATQA